MERSNVELCNRVDECQPVTHGSSRIEQLELNVVVGSPSLQKQEHPETAAFYRAYLREIKHNDWCVAQRHDRFTQMERGFAAHDAAFALNDRHFTSLVNVKDQHGLLSPLLAPQDHESGDQTQPDVHTR